MDRRAALVLVVACACGKKSSPPPPAPDDAGPPIVLEPMETPDLPTAKPSPFPPGTAEPAEGHTYSDARDLPEDAGLARCPSPPSKTAPVRLEMVVRPKNTIDLVVPSLGVRKRLWQPHPGEPSSCDAKLTEKKDGLRFSCTTDLGSVAGKVYARGSDVVLGMTSMQGKSVERFELPCGVRPALQEIACPAVCDARSESPPAPKECSCVDASARGPTPAATTSSR